MKFGERWLRQWVDPDMDSAALENALTGLGLEVEERAPAAAFTDDIVVGLVIETTQHENADRLRVCRVDDGAGEHQIVCGAPNVRPGIRVPMARIGTVMPSGMKIKASKLRGVASAGMLCSASELGVSEQSDGLMELAADAQVGTPLRDYLGLDDTLIDIGLTPNRGDCASIRGLALDLAARTQAPLTPPDLTPVALGTDQSVAVRIDPGVGCGRYICRVLDGVNPAAQTPSWMVNALRSAGIRSISLAVDVTNYVMLELGQPLHAFDRAQIQGGIHVRNAHTDESLRLLDGRDVSCDIETLLICDQERPLALAGIMGGENSGVENTSTTLLLESAWFAPDAIRGRLRHYRAHTESGYRFERGVDPELQHTAIERASALILAAAGGVAGPLTCVEQADLLPTKATITLRRSRLDRLLGFVIADDDITRILQALGCEVQTIEAGWQVVAPLRRADLAIEEDLIEEVIRLWGFDRIPTDIPLDQPKMRPVDEYALATGQLAQVLVERGYQEIVTYSFVDAQIETALGADPEQALSLANPISPSLAIMRSSLWSGMLRACARNHSRQQARVRFFETGLSYIRQGAELIQEKMIAGLISGNVLAEQWLSNRPVDFFDLRADLEALFALSRNTRMTLVAAEHTGLHPGRCANIVLDGEVVGRIGQIHPKLQEELDLTTPVYVFEVRSAALSKRAEVALQEVSRFPSVRRDLALLVDKSVKLGKMLAYVRDLGVNCLKDVVLFDIYEGQGVAEHQRSAAIGLLFQSETETLADTHVDALIADILKALNDQFGATLRS